MPINSELLISAFKIGLLINQNPEALSPNNGLTIDQDLLKNMREIASYNDIGIFIKSFTTTYQVSLINISKDTIDEIADESDSNNQLLMMLLLPQELVEINNNSENIFKDEKPYNSSLKSSIKQFEQLKEFCKTHSIYTYGTINKWNELIDINESLLSLATKEILYYIIKDQDFISSENIDMNILSFW